MDLTVSLSTNKMSVYMCTLMYIIRTYMTYLLFVNCKRVFILRAPARARLCVSVRNVFTSPHDTQIHKYVINSVMCFTWLENKWIESIIYLYYNK